MQISDNNKQIADKNMLIAAKEHEVSDLKYASVVDKNLKSAYEEGKSFDEKLVSDLKEEIKLLFKQKEDDLLKQVEGLRNQIFDRDTKITNMGNETILLQFQIKDKDIAITSLNSTIQWREKKNKSLKTKLAQVTDDFEQFKMSSRRDFEDMQVNLKEKNSLEIADLKVKFDSQAYLHPDHLRYLILLGYVSTRKRAYFA